MAQQVHQCCISSGLKGTWPQWVCSVCDCLTHGRWRGKCISHPLTHHPLPLPPFPPLSFLFLHTFVCSVSVKERKRVSETGLVSELAPSERTRLKVRLRSIQEQRMEVNAWLRREEMQFDTLFLVIIPLLSTLRLLILMLSRVLFL